MKGNKLETQKSINQWAFETFGKCNSLDTIFERYVNEVEELKAEVILRRINKIGNELADNLIVLYQVAEFLNIDLLREVNIKMITNRNRKWKLHGDGTGQHID